MAEPKPLPPVAFITAAELAERWNGALDVRTLANWRSQGKGPRFVKFGSRVRYPIVEVERWENENLQARDSSASDED